MKTFSGHPDYCLPCCTACGTLPQPSASDAGSPESIGHTRGPEQRCPTTRRRSEQKERPRSGNLTWALSHRAAYRNRTDDLLITSEPLWPTELRRRDATTITDPQPRYSRGSAS